MKLTKETLKKLIKEELEAVMSEGEYRHSGRDAAAERGVHGLGKHSADDMEKKRRAGAAADGAQSRDNAAINARADELVKEMMSEAQEEIMDRVLRSYYGKLMQKYASKYVSDIRNALVKNQIHRLHSLENISGSRSSGDATGEEIDGYISASASEAIKQMENLKKKARKKAEAEVSSGGGKSGKRSFLQKAGSFVTGKGFKEE
jgi:hypothetical protein